MASKVLVPTGPFTKLQVQVKKAPAEPSSSGFVISGDAVARVAHLEHSVRFLQEQHRLMLGGLHNEIEALRERNRDLQFQLIFNKESSPKTTSPVSEENVDSTEEANLKREVTRLEREAAAARGEARAAEARALQLQRLVDAQSDKLRALSLSGAAGSGSGVACLCEAHESRAELRARLADAERLVRRLRGDADRQRRELQCMKNSLHASLRATGLDGGYGFQNNYHFPPVHTPEFWREPVREDYAMMGRGRNARRPLTLPELSGQQIHRSTVYANPMVSDHTRPRANGYDKKKQANGDALQKTPEEPPERNRLDPIHTNISNLENPIVNSIDKYPELKIVVTKMIPQVLASTAAASERRPRRNNHRKHATLDHT